MIKGLKTAILTGALISAAWLHSPAEAGRGDAFLKLAARLDTPAIRYFLNETPTGRRFAQWAGVRDSADLAYILERAEMFPLRTELLKRLGTLEEKVADLRVLQSMEKNGPPFSSRDRVARPLSEKERLLIDVLSHRLLRLRKNAPDFFRASSKANLFPTPADLPLRLRTRQARSLFVSGKTFDDVLGEVPPLTRSAAAQRSALKHSVDFVKGLNTCLKNQPRQDGNQDLWRYLKGEVAISEILTVGGYLTNSGVADIKLTEMGTDMAVNAIATVASVKAMSGDLTYRVRWQRWIYVSLGRTAVDVIFYKFDVVDRASRSMNGQAPRQSPSWENTAIRAGYNVGWTAVQSPRVPAFYVLFSGLYCRYGHLTWIVKGKEIPWVKWGTDALRFGNGLGWSHVYFKVRKWVVPELSEDSDTTLNPSILIQQ